MLTLNHQNCCRPCLLFDDDSDDDNDGDGDDGDDDDGGGNMRTGHDR